MWQLNILINYKYRKYLAFLKQNISTSPHCPTGVVFALVKIGNEASLGIAMPAIKPDLLQSIRQWLAEIIVLSEKESMYQTLATGKKYTGALVKTLMLIDVSREIEYCYDKLDTLDETLCVHSFFNFRLSALKNKWKNNIKQLRTLTYSSEDQILDIFRQVILANQSDCTAKVVYDNDKWQLYISDTLSSATSDELDIVASLIIHSPATIEIYNIDSFATDTLLLLQFLFNGKIHLVSASEV